MEISYFLSAIRRRWWLPIVAALLGLAAGSFVGSPGEPEYEAQAVLLIQPPTNAGGGTVFMSDPDRYVIGQLEVLRSGTLAAEVATLVGGDETASSIGRSLRVVHQPKTDIVVVAVQSTDPAKAERIANTFADTYVGALKDRAIKLLQPQVDEFNRRLAEIQAKLAAAGKLVVDAQNRLSVANTSLAIGGTDEVATTPARAAEMRKVEEERITQIRQETESAASVLATSEAERQTYLSEYNNLNNSKTELELAANQKVATEVVQPAVVPRIAINPPTRILPVVGLLFGGILGAFLAVAWARLSGRLLDEAELEEVIETPLVGDFRKDDALSRDLAALLTKVPARHVDLVDQLCVRAEALAQSTTTLKVAVVGTRRPAATSALAVAMASRFAESGASVMLVDADHERAGVTRGFHATENGGIPALLARADARNGAELSLEAVGVGRSLARGTGKLEPELDPYTDSPIGEVKILGLGPKAGRQALRRSDVAWVLAGASQNANVIVVDGGALLDAASTVQLTREVDAVVLAIPMDHQEADELRVINEQLEGVRAGKRLLPVITHPGRRHTEQVD